MPPRRSRPSWVFFASGPPGAMIASERSSSAPTIASTIRLRRRSVISVRCQDEQQPAIVVVGGEDVCGCRLWPVSLCMDGNRLLEDAHPPFEGSADRIAVVGELQVENFLDRPAHHVLLAEARQLANAAADPYYTRVCVADEKRRVRGRVVVVEQLEEETEPALLAAAGALGESSRPLGAERAVSAVGADEVRHRGS